MKNTDSIGLGLLRTIVVDMLLDVLNVEEDQITPEARIAEDLGALGDGDSLDIRFRSMKVVSQDIPADDRWNRIIGEGTVDDLVRYLYELQGEI